MIQCAGSRDKRHLPHCSRLCCMIALKHAIRLKTLFPEMKITVCYLEMRTAGVGYEHWFLGAREAGVEFLRGTPPEVQFDAAGRPVIEVEDVTAARKRVLRPDLVVLSTGMVPAAETERLAADARRRPRRRRLHRHPRPQEPRHRDEHRGHLRVRLGRRSQGAHRGQHRGGRGRGPDPHVPHLARPPRHGAVPGGRRPVRGLRHLHDHVPLRRHHPGGPAGGRGAAGRGQGRRQARGHRRRDLPGLRHLRRQLPRGRVAHNLGDDALFGRIATHDRGRRGAGRRLLLQGVRRRRHQPERPAPRPATPRTCGSSSCRAWAASARCTSWRRPVWAPPACSSPAARRAAASTAPATPARWSS